MFISSFGKGQALIALDIHKAYLKGRLLSLTVTCLSHVEHCGETEKEHDDHVLSTTDDLQSH